MKFSQMIFGLKNFTAVCALLYLASTSGLNNSAIASVNNQTEIIAQGRFSGSNVKPHAVFKSILSKLQQNTQIAILLPKLIPGVEGENPLYAILENVAPQTYHILLGFSPDCTGGSACRFGSVSAEAVTNKTPSLAGKPVSLAKGITGYFVDFSCRANCSDATLTWRQKGVQYTVGRKAGDRTSLIKMANSAINP